MCLLGAFSSGVLVGGVGGDRGVGEEGQGLWGNHDIGKEGDASGGNHGVGEEGEDFALQGEEPL